MLLSGWGRYPVTDCRLRSLRQLDELPDILLTAGTLIARGNGRSYGDAALNPQLTLSMLEMNRMQSFDARTGMLTCEAGVLLSDILEAFTPRGWFPPVVPGTKFVTIGGMIAADVHGKNHHRDGAFGAHVESLTLATAGGDVLECSRTRNADVFHATIGGMGLTGLILGASFRLQPIETSFVAEETLAARDLDETLALFEASHDWPYSVAWIDCLAQGSRLGRSLLMRGGFMALNELPAELESDPLRLGPPGRLRVPVDAPSGMLNRLSAGAFNELYYQAGRARARCGRRPVHYERFFFHLDRIAAWNRLYGRAGFAQYQCVLPATESRAGMTALLEHCAGSGRGSFLAVLKLFGPAGKALMSFPMEGYTLALDFPMRRGTPELLDALDVITHAHGGRVYLAKDANSSPERVRQGYPGYDAFQAVRAELTGAKCRFASELSQRLAL